MANQSIISLPPNVEEPVVLRRFLARLVEQLDVVLGNRAGPAEQYVSQSELLSAANALAILLEEARELLRETKVELDNTDQIITEDLSKLIANNSKLIQDNTDYIDQTRIDVAENFVQAGYGGIGVNTPAVIGAINTTFQTLIGFDTLLVATPKNVTNDLATDSLALLIANEWELKAKVSLTFDEVNAGRTIQLRSYNLTQATPGTTTFNYFVGRNQGGVNLDISSLVDVGVAVGDKVQLQIGTDGDTYTNATNIGTTFYATHISEAGDTLPEAP